MCKAPSDRSRRGRKCIREVSRGGFTHSGRKGANSFLFTRRLNRRKLAPGNYTLSEVAYDRAANASHEVKHQFIVVR